jgi:hypothetical protein
LSFPLVPLCHSREGGNPDRFSPQRAQRAPACRQAEDIIYKIKVALTLLELKKYAIKDTLAIKTVIMRWSKKAFISAESDLNKK